MLMSAGPRWVGCGVRDTCIWAPKVSKASEISSEKVFSNAYNISTIITRVLWLCASFSKFVTNVGIYYCTVSLQNAQLFKVITMSYVFLQVA